jgi:lipoprotein-anchoring transpeptidase ErfK/SrfK
MAGPEPRGAVSLPDGALAPVPPGRWPRRVGPLTITRRAAGVAAVAVALLTAVAWAGTGYRYQPYVDEPVRLSGSAPTSDRELKQLVSRLDRRSRELTARLKAAAPRGVYIVIDQTQNRLYLKKDEETLLDATCSAGSGMVLKESVGKKREWVFDTPRGRFEVLSMLRDPVWAKPDWAFVEEGQPIPTNPADRIESGSLGEYALHFGNGYLIHGTLYERLLGRAVSHGCIRVGRNDLRKVWANARIGTHIYIY